MIYYAGPLFNAAERAFNVELTAALESLGCEVFLPQRDGVEANKLPYSAMSRDERRKAMFELDRDMIEGCDIFLFILDGRIPDEGACVELGIAYAHRRATGVKRILLGFQTDIRSAFMGSKLNPMIRVPLDYIVTSTDELLAYIREQSQDIRKTNRNRKAGNRVNLTGQNDTPGKLSTRYTRKILI